MKALSCAAARRRLQAYHDDELTVVRQIEVGAHLEGCGDCTAALEELQLLRAALRTAAPGRAALSRDESIGFHASEIGRAHV